MSSLVFAVENVLMGSTFICGIELIVFSLVCSCVGGPESSPGQSQSPSLTDLKPQWSSRPCCQSVGLQSWPAPFRPALSPGTLTLPPNSLVLVLPQWVWPAQEQESEQCSAASSLVMPGTPLWSSSSFPTPSWALLCLRLWVSSVWWWRSSSCSPCKSGNTPTTPFTYPFFPASFFLFAPLLPSKGGTPNVLVGYSINGKKSEGNKPPTLQFCSCAIFVFQKFYVRPHFG